MEDNPAMQEVYRKIEKEELMINNTMKMMQVASPQVRVALDTELREAQRNLAFLNQRRDALQQEQAQQSMARLSMNDSQGRGPGQAGYGGPAQGDYQDQLGAGSGMMPPKAPFSPQGPGQSMPKARPNYSKLDLIKADTQHLGPRYQMMLSQLAFKLTVEKQYKEGIEKVSRLYDIDGDKKSRQEAEGRRIECNQKIQLLQKALRRYEDLNVGFSSADEADDDSINQPQGRKPLSGLLTIKLHAVRDVGHQIGTNSYLGRKTGTFVQVKVEDMPRAATKETRTDRWLDENHVFDVDKANEVELTVYDTSGSSSKKLPVPVGLLWIRLSDIVEEMRRKKIEQELAGSQWMTADQMGQPTGGGGGGPQSPGYGGGPGGPGGNGQRGSVAGVPGAAVAGQTGSDPNLVEAWFSLEPVGSIFLSLSFVKQNRGKTNLDVGLGRKGAVRQRKEDVLERYGHRFVQQQFFNIMRCAYCGELLKYSAGMQCEDCKYLCHTTCYARVVTKCISKSNADTDPDEVKLNHRIPHRFNPFTNFSANWCCHCGMILAVGKRNARKCSECQLTCHASCQHLVPDFCGLNTDQIEALLSGLKQRRQPIQATRPPPMKTSSQMKEGTLGVRPPAPGNMPSYNTQPESQRPGSYTSQESYNNTGSGQAAKAATRPYSGQQSPGSPSGSRPDMGQRTTTADAAAAAAAALAKHSGYPPAGASEMPGDTPQSPPIRPYQPGDYRQFEIQQEEAARAQNQQQWSQAHDPYGQQQQQQQPQAQPARLQQAQQATQPAQATQEVARRTSQPAAAKQSQRRIGLEHFNFLAVLGKGNFGKVMLAETKGTKKLYAIKVLKKEFIIENDEVESTRSEKRVFLIANKERHPFLINLHACFQTETRIYFVMEYISGGDLMLHIQRGQFGLKRSVFYASEVCLALKHFHENGVIYRDLKLDNIMLTMDGHIKVADYGLCKENMWYGKSTGTFCGTPEFMAPEILLDKKYGRAVDWWAFGVLIYQMLLQQSPFRGEDEDEIYDAILADEPLYPIHMPRDSVAILQKLLTREPEMRLGSGPTDAAEVMQQPFFKTVNWEDVRAKRIPPPYLPQIKNATDTSNFDSEFTSVTPVLTPVQSVLTQQMQEEFRGFSYTGDFD